MNHTPGQSRHPYHPPERTEARNRLRQAAKRFDQESAGWVEQHPSEALGLALVVGWLLARYPRLRRVLERLLVEYLSG